MSEIEDIKVKLNIVDLIREYIPVKAAGVNFQALCPFHNEKTPSFVISPDKQIWHCFGCGRGGDIFSFIMEKEGLDFSEALRLLASKAGVELKQGDRRDHSKLNRLLDVMDLAGKYYAHILQTPTGKIAKDYLLKRGLTEETIKDWQLGYSLDSWSSLYDFLRERPKTGRKFSDEEIEAAGLVIKKNNISEGRQYYDRFRGRIMFPIWDFNNNLVAFTARVSPEKEKTEKMGKYINSPQTSIYDKSKILFGLNKAKSAIREEGFVIVVEGQMDVIKYHDNGIKNVIASSGTALTSQQVTLLKRLTNDVVLFFDMDEAGQIANDRGIRELLAQDMRVKIMTTPYGKDADEALKNNPEAVKRDTALGAFSESDFDFEEYYKRPLINAKLVLEYYLEKVSSGLNLEKLENKIVVRDKMFDMIFRVNSKTEQGYWLKKISEELDFSETDIREEFVRFVSSQKNNNYNQEKTNIAPLEEKKQALSREEMLSELVLSLVIKFPELFNYFLENLDVDKIFGERNIAFYKTLIIYYNKAASFSYEAFHKYLENDDNLLKLLDRLLLLGEKEFYNHTLEEARQEAIKISLDLKRHFYQKKIKSIEKEISMLEKLDSFDEAKMTELMESLKNATLELKKLM